MQVRTCIIFCALIFSSVLEAGEAVSISKHELLYNARVFEARDRGDLARLALEKLTAARPDSPEALLELGELNLRIPDMRAAEEVLSRLNKRFPGSAATRTFAIEYRFATRDRLQLASLRRLIQLGRAAEAQRELDRLFPEGAPGGMLSIEYYRMLASTPVGWAPAYRGLKELVAAHPDDPRYEFALAKHLLGSDSRFAEGIAALGRLAHRQDVRVAEIDNVLAKALRDVGFRAAPALIEEYLARNPDDTEARNALQAMYRASEESELIARGALARVAPERQQQNLRELRSALAALASSEPLAEEGSALLTLLDEQLPKRAAGEDGTTLAAIWMARATESQRASRLELAAAQLHASVVIRTGRYEETIPIAVQLELLGEHPLSGELLAAASRLDRASVWLFETQVRWLINHERADEALSLLETRRPDKRWTAQSRDTLRALALDRRAQSHASAGRTDEAIADLETSVALAPSDPWSRYRLAKHYAQKGDGERGRAVFDDGLQHARGDPSMRYAQATFLASIDDYERALEVIDSIPADDRTEGTVQLQARSRIELARAQAQRLKATGDVEGARAVLLDLEPLAQVGVEPMRQIAFAWVDLDDSARAIALIGKYTFEAEPKEQVLLARAEVLDRADNMYELGAVLDEVRELSLSGESRASAARLQKSLDLRRIRALQSEGDVQSAARRLDEMLKHAPDDRQLRVARAELDLAARDARAASERLTALALEQPDDLETRLTYVRALTDSGERELARKELEAIQGQAPAHAIDLRLGIARRQLAIGDAAAAQQTTQAVLEIEPERADALLLAGRAAQQSHKYSDARHYYMRAQRTGNELLAAQARAAQDQVDARLQSWVEAAVQVHEKPGEAGISQFDLVSVPVAWVYTSRDARRFVLRTDAIRMEAGSPRGSFDSRTLLGSIQAAGAGAQQRYKNDEQHGVSLGLEYATDTLRADVGTTPRGFLLPRVVGGLEWAPGWGGLDIAVGLSRRAVTSSVLSFGGLRDPITGAAWGGVVATGPYARVGLYRERYAVSAALAAAEASGTRVPDNEFFRARATADWKFLAHTTARAYLGLTLNYWGYERNLQHYTFGSGGYYSPKSYLSVAIPLELEGSARGWSYRVRASLAQTWSKTDRAPFHPGDASLQRRAADSPLPPGFDEAYFPSSRGSGLSMSVYAGIERQLSRALVLGAKIDIDRADYYEPTTYMLYLRQTFGPPATPLASPPRPVTQYTEY